MASVCARAEARFKQLCCLGLGGEAVMPALLWQFHDIVPCVGTSFFFSDARGELANIYDEHPETPRIAPLIESGEVGVLVADTEGRPIFATPEGRRLLFLSTHPRISPSATTRRLPKLPQALIDLCRSLARVLAGDLVAPAPMHRCSNTWGGFTFRAQWLEQAPTAPALVAITISHQEPIPLRLARALERLPLSRRQGNVALLLAMGKSYEEIGERLGIATGTAITHGRWVYHKLAVSTRIELLHAMLAA